MNIIRKTKVKEKKIMGYNSNNHLANFSEDEKKKLIAIFDIVDPVINQNMDQEGGTKKRESGLDENFYNGIFTDKREDIVGSIFTISEKLKKEKADRLIKMICAYAGLDKQKVKNKLEQIKYSKYNPAEMREHIIDIEVESVGAEYDGLVSVKDTVDDISSDIIKNTLDKVENDLNTIMNVFENEVKRAFGMESDDFRDVKESVEQFRKAMKCLRRDLLSPKLINIYNRCWDDVKKAADIYLENKNKEKDVKKRKKVGKIRFKEMEKLSKLNVQIKEVIPNGLSTIDFPRDNVLLAYKNRREEINHSIEQDFVRLDELINSKDSLEDKIDLINDVMLMEDMGLNGSADTKKYENYLGELTKTDGKFDFEKYKELKVALINKCVEYRINVGKDIVRIYHELRNDPRYDAFKVKKDEKHPFYNEETLKNIAIKKANSGISRRDLSC